MPNEKIVQSKGLLTQIKSSTRLQYQKEKIEQNRYDTIELQFEIECPRCYDIMALCSDFNGLYYFCKLCGFSLHTQ
jgi:uncharacterized protein (DUF983 family)